MLVYQKSLNRQLVGIQDMYFLNKMNVFLKKLFVAVHVVGILCINIMSQLRSSSGFYLSTLPRFLSIAQSILIEHNVTYIHLINASLQLSSFLVVFITTHSNTHLFLRFSFSLFYQTVIFHWIDTCIIVLPCPISPKNVKNEFLCTFKKQQTSSNMHTTLKVTYL